VAKKLKRNQISEWFKQFQGGSKSMEDYVKRYVQKSLNLGPTITSLRITQPEQKPPTNTYRNANRSLSFERTS